MKTVEWKLVCKIDGKIVDIERDVDASTMEEIGNDVCNGIGRGTVEMCDPEIVLEVSAETIRMVLDAGNKVFDGKKIEAKDTRDWPECSVSNSEFIKGIPLSEGKDNWIVTTVTKTSGGKEADRDTLVLLDQDQSGYPQRVAEIIMIVGDKDGTYIMTECDDISIVLKKKEAEE